MFTQEIPGEVPREVPRSEWADFCDSFSRQHRGGLATIEMARPGAAPQTIADELPLRGLTLNSKSHEADTLLVTLGQHGDERLTHAITQVVRLCFDVTEAGAQAGLTFESADGTITRLRFRVPVFPEMVDGVMLFDE
ncbi:MAG: DUF5335 family protein [Anaerolineales bacterium]